MRRPGAGRGTLRRGSIAINRFLRKRFAVEIRSYVDIASDLTRLVGADAAVILDVGANTGQSAKLFSRLFPQATIFAIEPFGESYEAIVAQRLPRVQPRLVAIGDHEGKAVLHVNSESVTNSLLPASDQGLRFFPGQLAPITTTEVDVTTLDSFVTKESIRLVDLLKIDVQGAEMEVIRGGKSLLSQVRVIQIECNFIPTYEGSSLFSEVDIELRGAGFDFYSFYGLHQDPESRQVVFADGLFVNSANLVGTPVDNKKPAPHGAGF